MGILKLYLFIQIVPFSLNFKSQKKCTSRIQTGALLISTRVVYRYDTSSVRSDGMWRMRAVAPASEEEETSLSPRTLSNCGCHTCASLFSLRSWVSVGRLSLPSPDPGVYSGLFSGTNPNNSRNTVQQS